MSASSIYKNINKEKYNITTCYISKENKWYKFDGDFDSLIKNDWIVNHEEDTIFNIIKYLQSFDLVFPILHGYGGEDGKIQGMLELFNIPFIGCNAISSNIGMDKITFKNILSSAGLPTLPFVNINYDDYMIEDIIYNLDFPMIVKPSNGGSSIGITKVNTIKELDNAIKKAAIYDKYILIEPFINAQELECAVIENDDIIVSTIGEINAINDFYDYEAKYENNTVQTIIPANIPDTVSEEIKTYAKKVFKLIRGRGLSRIDFFYDTSSNKIYLNEINTIPGFTTISMYPKLFQHDGISYSKLLDILINNAIKKI